MGRVNAERFWARVNKTDKCWFWAGATTTKGYGQVQWGGRRQYAHRVSYKITIGPIKKGLTLDHLCRVRNCVRPSHLEQVTNAVNVRRGISAVANRQNALKRTHCRAGHLFDRRKHKRCQTCNREAQRRFAARQKVIN